MDLPPYYCHLHSKWRIGLLRHLPWKLSIRYKQSYSRFYVKGRCGTSQWRRYSQFGSLFWNLTQKLHGTYATFRKIFADDVNSTWRNLSDRCIYFSVRHPRLASTKRYYLLENRSFCCRDMILLTLLALVTFCFSVTMETASYLGSRPDSAKMNGRSE